MKLHLARGVVDLVYSKYAQYPEWVMKNHHSNTACLLVGDGYNFIGCSWSRSNSSLQMRFLDGHEAPLRELWIDINTRSLVEGSSVDLADALTRLQDGIVYNKCNIPYGYVVNRQVKVIRWTKVSPNSDATIFTVADGQFVLKDYDLPLSLRFKLGEGAQYMERFRQMFRSGQVVELTERINAYPTEIWYTSDGRTLPQLQFTPDKDSPGFGQDYVYWPGMQDKFAGIVGSRSLKIFKPRHSPVRNSFQERIW